MYILVWQIVQFVTLDTGISVPVHLHLNCPDWYGHQLGPLPHCIASIVHFGKEYSPYLTKITHIKYIII